MLVSGEKRFSTNDATAPVSMVATWDASTAVMWAARWVDGLALLSAAAKVASTVATWAASMAATMWDPPWADMLPPVATGTLVDGLV